jgi:hypothetical protein
MNYDDDAGDRLIALLAEKNVAFRANLVPAARNAGEQLELLKPMVLMPGGRRALLAGSSAVMVDPGTMLVVLADADRAMTMKLSQPPAGFTWR